MEGAGIVAGERDGVEVFEEHRRLLLAVAYRMLGSQTEADDVVQDAWLRWRQVDGERVADPRAYLVKVVTRAAIDQLRRANTRREAYVGPWLPEPLLTGPDVADEAALADTVSMAMLVVLETLSPLERAVFVLREAFGFTGPEIAAALGRSEQAVRQVTHRAREHVRARRPRFTQDRAVRRAATERFMAAAIGGDLNELMEVLAPDVQFWADGGGRVKAPRRLVFGLDQVARLLVGSAADVRPGTEIHMVDVNGGPAAVATSEDGPYAVFVLDVDADSGLVAVIRLIANPEKLAGLHLDQPPEATAGPR